MEEKLHRRWVKIGGKKGSIFNGKLQTPSKQISSKFILADISAILSIFSRYASSFAIPPHTFLQEEYYAHNP